MTIMNHAQLERLLTLLESLPPASIPLDAESAAALGTSTDPEEVFTTAVEAIFVNEEYDAIEALLEVVAHVTGTSPAPLLKAVTEKKKAPAAPAPAPAPVEEEEEEEEETEDMYDVPEGEEDEAAPRDAVQPPKYGSPEWKKERAKEVAKFRERVAHPEREKWLTGGIQFEGLQKFIHIVRGPDDPERGPRIKGQETAWRKKLSGDPEPWKKELYTTLKKEGPMTFNKLALLTSGYTADVVAGKAPDQALWQLVGEGKIKFTVQSPVLFKVVEKAFGQEKREGWTTVGQQYDVASAADKKLWWEQSLKHAREAGKKWPLDVWGKEIKTQEQYGKSLYRPGMKWPKKGASGGISDDDKGGE